MRKSSRITAVLLFALTFTAHVVAEDDSLKAVRTLLAQRDYAAAMETWTRIDPSRLSQADRAAYDQLAPQMQTAYAGYQRAQNDLIDADRAYSEQRWGAAEKQYRGVAENPYASESQLAHARAQRQRIGERLQLLDAARPMTPLNSGPQNGTRTTTTTTPPPAAMPMTPVQSGTSTGSSATPPPGTTRVYMTPVPQTGTPATRPATPMPMGQMTPTPGHSGSTPYSPTPESPYFEPTPGFSAPTAGLPARLTIVDQLRMRDDLIWARAEAQMVESARLARQALDEGRFTDARQLADQALQVIEAAKAYAEPLSKYEAARGTALLLQQEVADRIGVEGASAAEREAEEIARAVETRRQTQEQLRIAKVEQLLQTAEQLRKERRYTEAAEAVRQVRAIDPGNADAAAKLDIYEDLASLAGQAALDDTIHRQQRGLFDESREALVPWYQDILYPKNWIELTNRRREYDPSFGFGADSELNRTLDKERGVEEFIYEEAPLGDVFDALGAGAQINLNVDWDDLSSIGIHRDKPVTVRLKHTTYRTVLKTLLLMVSGEVELDYSVNDGLVRVASREKLDRDKLVRVYDIRDLLINIPKFRGPDIEMAFDGVPSVEGGPDSVGPRSLFDEFASGAERAADSARTSGLVEQVMDIIRTTVNPDSWRENGGRDGALRELNGQLIVYGTSDTQGQVSNLLSQLRETRALQIAVESRFLIVTSNFLEEIGVDLDFVFNSGEAGFDPAFNNQGGIRDNFTGAPILIPRQFSRAGVTPNIPAFGNPIPQGTVLQPYGQAGFVPSPGGVVPGANEFTPIPVQQGGIALVNPSVINTGVPGSLGPSVINPALNIAGSFLDNLQVDFLVRATQANRRSSIVQAPRLLMFNGQRAFVAIQRTRQYVASLTPNVAEGAVGVTPVIANIASGTVLDVEGTISADRRYVTITVRTTLTDEPQFERFEIQRQSGNSPGLFILLPDQQIRQINTTVSVPDGGTVLLGGLKQVGEVEVEAGVPVLSKIPVLKRAFTNATTVKDVQTLLILLKTKILIQKEAEEDVFPGLTSAGL